jgi:hypothetical protein
MSRRTRRLLALILILVSLALLAYAFWPLGADVDRALLPPEIFRPPDASLLWPGGVV